MCGLIAVCAQAKDKAKYLNIFVKLLHLSKTRGSDSSGVLFIRHHDICVIKGSMPIDKLFRTPEFKKNFRILENSDKFFAFGHTRMETHGSKFSHKNNHPVISQGIAVLHNGIITNADSIWSSFTKSSKETQVDSEILCAVVRNALNHSKDLESFKEMMQSNLSLLKGSYSFIALVPSLKSAILSTNTGSLYMAQIDNGGVKDTIYASEERILREGLSSNDFNLKSYTITQVNPYEIKTIQFDTSYDTDLQYDIHEIGAQNIDSISKQSIDVGYIERLVIEGYEKTVEFRKELQHCRHCILPSTMPFISFDVNGICNFCNRFETPVLSDIRDLINSIESKFARSKFKRVLLPFSGGRDSSYALHYIKEVLNMPVITCTYDWGMLTDLGRRNQARMLGALNVENILLSADINLKRSNINKNLSSWLKDPNLGIVPLLMAGDKHYFRHLNKVRNELGDPPVIYSDNPLEKSDFKYGFANVHNNPIEKKSYGIGAMNSVKLLWFYGLHFLSHSGYWNSSLTDTISAYWSSYFEPKEFLHLYKYVQWKEDEIISVLQSTYDWELSQDTSSSWRIGDGTAALYNHIYFLLGGLTEHDTFRSNQVRCGIISRDQAWELALSEARPRIPSLLWYFDTIKLSALEALRVINSRALYNNFSAI